MADASALIGIEPMAFWVLLIGFCFLFLLCAFLIIIIVLSLPWVSMGWKVFWARGGKGYMGNLKLWVNTAAELILGKNLGLVEYGPKNNPYTSKTMIKQPFNRLETIKFDESDKNFKKEFFTEENIPFLRRMREMFNNLTPSELAALGLEGEKLTDKHRKILFKDGKLKDRYVYGPFAFLRRFFNNEIRLGIPLSITMEGIPLNINPYEEWPTKDWAEAVTIGMASEHEIGRLEGLGIKKKMGFKIPGLIIILFIVVLIVIAAIFIFFTGNTGGSETVVQGGGSSLVT